MKILLNILGILIFFFTKLAGRKDKTEPLSVKFWIKDNWEQLVVVALIDVALMLLLVTGGLKLSFEKLPNIPDWLQVVGDGAACLLIGAFLAYAGYGAYKKIIIDKR